jgi:hypothetical protein
MRMRKTSWIMASPPPHFTISSNRHVDITGCSNLQSMRMEKSPTSIQNFIKIHRNYLVIKCAQTDNTGEVQVWLGWVGLG